MNTENKDDVYTPITDTKLLFKTILKGFTRALTRKGTYINAGLVMLCVWILHTYMVVYLNEGINFEPDTGILYNFISIKYAKYADLRTGAALFWLLFTFLLKDVISSIGQFGFLTFIGKIFSFPFYIKDCFMCGANKKSPIFYFFVILGILPSLFFHNSMALLCLSAILLISLSKRMQSLLLFSTAIIIKDIKSVFSKSRKFTVNVGSIGIAYFALSIGAMISAVMIFFTTPYLRHSGDHRFIIYLIIAIFFILFSISLIRKKDIEIGTAVMFILMAFIFGHYHEVLLADDGGWAEGGGNLMGWLRSPGAGATILIGWISAFFGFIGTVLATVPGTVAGMEDLTKSSSIDTVLAKSVLDKPSKIMEDLTERLSSGNSPGETSEETPPLSFSLEDIPKEGKILSPSDLEYIANTDWQAKPNESSSPDEEIKEKIEEDKRRRDAEFERRIPREDIFKKKPDTPIEPPEEETPNV